MKFRRDKKAKSPSAGRRSMSARQARPRTQTYANTGGHGLPGTAGYPEGPRSELPFFFEMRRPDGRPDAPPDRRPSKKFAPR